MIDYLSLALIHSLLALMVIRLSSRADLDREQASDPEGQPDA